MNICSTVHGNYAKLGSSNLEIKAALENRHPVWNHLYLGGNYDIFLILIELGYREMHINHS